MPATDVLVLEPDTERCRALGLTLKGLHFQPVLTSSLEEAMARAGSGEVKAVIADWGALVHFTPQQRPSALVAQLGASIAQLRAACASSSAGAQAHPFGPLRVIVTTETANVDAHAAAIQAGADAFLRCEDAAEESVLASYLTRFIQSNLGMLLTVSEPRPIYASGGSPGLTVVPATPPTAHVTDAFSLQDEGLRDPESGRWDAKRIAEALGVKHTSPHKAKVGGVRKLVQTASQVLCFSRLLFFQMYPRFTRFECKVFLDEANAYAEGAADVCMIDNTHVVVLSGTGKEMVPVPEMVAFAERYGFHFEAHEKGDANRSARVEGHFNWIEKNFLAGREFRDFAHLNAEARTWCDKVNAARSNKLAASRRELYALERTHLKPRPLWTPPIYLLHQRFVDAEGFIHLHRNRYSVPYRLIARCMEVRELKDRVLVFDGPRQVAEHAKVLEPRDARVIVPEHRPPRGQGPRKDGPPPEEAAILKAEPRLASFVFALRANANGRGTLPLRRLLGMLRDYPREPFVAAVARAEQYGLFDLGRLERMVLKQIAHDYFVLPVERDELEDDDDR